MVDIDTAGREFTISNTFSRAFGVMGGAPVPVFGVSFLFGAVPQAIWSLAVPMLMGGSAPGDFGAIVVGGLLGMLVLIAFYVICQGALIRVTVEHGEGRETSIGQAIGTGLAMALPLLGLGILIGLGVWIGFILLLVPGIMLAVMWSVAAPALVDERTAIIGALSRSRALTKGARWKILGLFMLLIVLIIIISIFAGLLMMGTSGLTGMARQEPTIPMLIFGLVFNTLFVAFYSTVINAMFVELRNWKDGLAPGNLAEVFS